MKRHVKKDEQGEITVDRETLSHLRMIAYGYSLMRRGVILLHEQDDPMEHCPSELQVEMRVRWMAEQFIKDPKKPVVVEDSDAYIEQLISEAREMSEFFDAMKKQGEQ